MPMKTHMSLSGFIATDPELRFTKDGTEYVRVRVGIEQWRKEVDGAFTKLDPTFHDMVAWEATAREIHARFRPGDSFIAAGHVHEYEDTQVPGLIKEQFVARKIGHNATRTAYEVQRPETAPAAVEPVMTASSAQATAAPAVGF